MTYLGVENWYGNVWKMIDGLTVDGTWTGSPAAMPMYYTNNGANFTDQSSVKHRLLTNASYIGAAAGYSSNIEDAIGFIPSRITGGSNTAFITDYYYQYSEAGRDYWRVPLSGGISSGGSAAGGFALGVFAVWSVTDVAVSARLAY